MPQGHQKFTRLFLHVHRWWGWWTNIPGKWSARMRLLWFCIISRVVHLRTSSLLAFRSIFTLSISWPSVLLSSLIFWGIQGSVLPLLSCIKFVYIPCKSGSVWIFMVEYLSEHLFSCCIRLLLAILWQGIKTSDTQWVYYLIPILL